MPRLQTRFLWRAHIKNPLYLLLLQKCRMFQLEYKEELRCIHNEFMWLKELAEMTLRMKLAGREDVRKGVKQRCMAKLARRMVRGQKLPQVMESQPFGSLDIECPIGAFSPHQRTEASTKHLARLITTEMRDYEKTVTTIRIVDLCSGTGCIPLLLLSLLSEALPDMQLEVTGVDISPTAVALAKRNYTRNLSKYPNTSRHSVSFVHDDLFRWRGHPHWEEEDDYDASIYTVVTCNPPYMTSFAFQQQTERLAKKYAPDLALGCLSQEETAQLEFSFPPPYDEIALGRKWWDEDNKFPVEYIDHSDFLETDFYHGAAWTATILGARMMMLEVGGTQQAVRVANMPYDGHQFEGRWDNIEVWGEEPDAPEGVVVGTTEDEAKRSRDRLWRLHFCDDGRMLHYPFPLRGAGVGTSVLFSDRNLRWRQ